MFNFRAYSKDSNGQVKKAPLKTLVSDGIVSVYADSVVMHNFDPDEAVKVKIIVADAIDGILAVSKDSPYWTGPVFATGLGDVPKGTQAVLLKKSDGTYIAVLPVVGKEFKTELIGENGCLFSKTFSWYKDSCFLDELLFVCGAGKNPFELIKKCFKRAISLLDNRCRMREERSYPEILEYLGWCSWDSMQIRVNEADIEKKCKEFKDKDIPVKWVVIDDMWAEIRDFYGEEYSDFKQMVDLMHRSKMYSYKADPIRFPYGLSHTVDMLHSYGMYVGMWYPTTGYWAGIDENGDAYKELCQFLLTTGEGVTVPHFEADMAYMYYKKIFDYFRKSGVDFVKIDNQALPQVHYKGIAPVGKTASGAVSGMEAAVGEAFGDRIINCMGMSGEMMWNRSSSGVSRCSNDFMPENRKWFAKHILQCTYNGLVQGQLYYNDFDMWWTDDEQAQKNSLLRAVSGGPIYVSDKIGRTNKEILAPLILSDGRILRCDRCAVPSEDCLASDPRNSGRIFKVQNTYKDSGVLAAFNLDKNGDAVNGTVSPKDIYGLSECQYAIYEHFSRELKILSYDETFSIVLENNDDFKLYIMAPIRENFAVIGRVDKFISPATVENVFDGNVILKENGPYAYVKDNELIIKQ